MKKYIACLLAAILLLTMLPASASAEGGMQACHRVTAKYTDSKQSNKSGIRLWSVKTALTSVDDEINGLAQAYADKIAPTLQAGKANGDKNSRLDVEIRHSKTGLTWMSFLVQARTTYHRDLIAQEFTSRTFDMTTGERILLTDIFPEGSEGWTILREKLEAQINYYFPDETPDPDAVAQVLSDEGLRNLDFTLHGMSLVIHLSADAFYPEHHTLIETTLFYPDIREYMTEKAQIETDNLSYYKTVALTFDDGPTGKKDGYPNGLTNYLLDGLKQRGAVATFLMVGERVSEVSDVLPRMVNEGHELGNHTMNHPMCHLTGLGTDDIRSQIDDATNAIKDIAGQAPQVLRPVGGGVNSDVKAVAAELNYPIINWSVDTEDWKYRDADHVKKVIVEQAQDGDVVLMHDLYETSVRGALAAIDELQSRTDKTYAFVTVSQLAAIHGITLEPGVVYNGLTDEVAQQIADGSYSPTEFT